MRINYERRGAGTPLVLIHGIGHRWQAWEPVIDRLASHHDVWAIDLPGFGESPVPDGGMPDGMPGMVTAISAAFAQLGLEKPHVVGNSLGGAIALELAAAGLAASATAFSPAGFFTETERRRALRTLSRMRTSTFAPAFMIRTVLAVPALRKTSFGTIMVDPQRLSLDRAVQDSLAMRRGKGFRPVVKASAGYAFQGTPDCPVTVAWGSRDRIFRPHQLDRVADRIPHARRETLPGCGHVPMSDDPDLVTSLILATTAAH